MKKQILVLSSLLMATSVFASDVIPTDSLINLNGVVVTANKIQVNRGSVPLSISVIEREEIEASSESAYSGGRGVSQVLVSQRVQQAR